MTARVLCVLDPIERIDVDGDSTYAMLHEACRRGHEVWTCQEGHLSLEHDDPVAAAQQTAVNDPDHPDGAFVCQERTAIPLEAFDVVLMRKDPPVNEEYVQATWILERARGKTLLVNDPRGLRELNEHLSILNFPDLIPPTIVTRDTTRLRAFLEEQGGAIVLKPVEGFGGRGIFLCRTGDPNLSSIFETSTQDGAAWTMAQRYLPEATQGDKRILLAGGEPIGAVLRVPPADEVRDNLHVGGKAHATEITAAERRIIQAVKPLLQSYGQLFVGLDVIGERLTEINITSPTGLRHIDQLENRISSSPLWECIERKLAG